MIRVNSVSEIPMQSGLAVVNAHGDIDVLVKMECGSVEPNWFYCSPDGNLYKVTGEENWIFYFEPNHAEGDDMLHFDGFSSKEFQEGLLKK